MTTTAAPSTASSLFDVLRADGPDPERAEALQLYVDRDELTS